MTTPTSPWNIPLFASGDTLPSLEGVLNSQSNALNTALNSIQLTTYALYATRALLLAVSGTVVGQHATVNADSTAANNTDYYWTGSTWLPLRASGLVPIVPTVSGSGVSVGAGGVVTFAAASAGIITGFRAAFDDYLFKIDQTGSSTPNTINFTLANGATPLASGYDSSLMYGQNSTSSAIPTLNAPNASITNVGTLGKINLEVNSPFLTAATLATADYFQTNNPGTAAVMTNGKVGILQRATTSCDGIQLSASSGTMNITVRLFGYNNN